MTEPAESTINDNVQLTPQEIQQLREALRILANISSDLNNAIRNQNLFEISTMSKGNFLENLFVAVEAARESMKKAVQD